MRDLVKLVFDSVLTLRTQLHAALSIPVSDPMAFDESNAVATDGMAVRNSRRSYREAFKFIDDHPGYLSGNGLGSLEIGGDNDD